MAKRCMHSIVESPVPDKRIIKGRPLEVGFDRSHQSLHQGGPL
jgi:hypothetical protein